MACSEAPPSSHWSQPVYARRAEGGRASAADQRPDRHPDPAHPAGERTASVVGATEADVARATPAQNRRRLGRGVETSRSSTPDTPANPPRPLPNPPSRVNPNDSCWNSVQEGKSKGAEPQGIQRLGSFIRSVNHRTRSHFSAVTQKQVGSGTRVKRGGQRVETFRSSHSDQRRSLYGWPQLCGRA